MGGTIDQVAPTGNAMEPGVAVMACSATRLWLIMCRLSSRRDCASVHRMGSGQNWSDCSAVAARDSGDTTLAASPFGERLLQLVSALGPGQHVADLPLRTHSSGGEEHHL